MVKMNDLISVLEDPSASLSDRDDAAMDLADFDEALPTLIKVASNPLENEDIQQICGTSIAEIWKRQDLYDEDILNALSGPAASEIKAAFS